MDDSDEDEFDTDAATDYGSTFEADSDYATDENDSQQGWGAGLEDVLDNGASPQVTLSLDLICA